jgi:hypothetical protein
MAVFNPNVTDADAQRAIAAKQGIGKQRFIPPVLAEVREIMNRRIHVFNVGPWGQTVNTGSTGSFIIPACPFGTEYVEMLEEDREPGSPTFKKMVPPVKAIMRELVIQSEDAMTPLDDSGRYFAWQMLGVGRGLNPNKALTRFGIFVGAGDAPTKEELAKARQELEKECKAIYKFAEDFYVTDRKLFSRAVRPEVHFVAAKVLGRDNPMDSPWMGVANPAARIKCNMCGRVCEADVATCEAGHIVNAELYADLMASQEEILAATKPKSK